MRADLTAIHEAGVRAADLTQHLLAFSRQQVLKPTVIDLNKVIGRMENMLRRVIGEDIELISIGEPGLPEILGDASQMEQIMMNLVVNARDAMPTGGRLTIETSTVCVGPTSSVEHPGVEPGTHIMLVVTDTGMGMDQVTQTRIFEPFFTTKESGKGTGLGLSTVFGIVKQSNGAIWADSEPGKGASFTVCFPVLEPSAVHAKLPSLPPTAAEAVTLRGSETVLIVEDDERVRVLARTILRKYGYQVLEAQSGGDALIVCEQHTAPIHLLLTDVVLPRVSGPELAARLVVSRPDMKVLYMSGYAGGANLQVALHGAGASFLQKPITPEVLAKGVREALGAPRAISTEAAA